MKFLLLAAAVLGVIYMVLLRVSVLLVKMDAQKRFTSAR